MDIEQCKKTYEMLKKSKQFIANIDKDFFLNFAETVLSELEKKDEYIKMLTDEREHIKNNLKVDLNRKGVFSQAKGQIAQILECYENNEKYFNKVEREGK